MGQLPYIQADPVATVNVTAAGESAAVTYALDDGVLPLWGAPTWRDEFTGSVIDTTKWRVRDGDYLSYDMATIMARNAAIVNNQLVLTGKLETVRTGRPYTTAYLDTIGKSSFKFGRWEMRAQIDTVPNASRGVWPAFWLRADSLAGEIDIMEAWGTPADNPQWLAPGGYTSTLHENTSGAGSKYGLNIAPWDGAPLSSGFHTYAVEWYADRMLFILDGKVGATMLATDVGSWFTTSMADTFNIRLNLQMGCTYQGDPDASTILPTQFIIDYVRYWAPYS